MTQLASFVTCRGVAVALEKTLLNVCGCDQSCLTLCGPMGYSPTVSSVHGISQARILGQVPGIEPTSLASPALAGGFFTITSPGKTDVRMLASYSEIYPKKKKRLYRVINGWRDREMKR